MKKIMIVSFLFMFLFAFSVSAVRLICLTEGQGVPPDNPRYVCDHTLCQVCTTDSYFPTNPTLCADEPGCTYLNSTGGGGIDLEPPVPVINSPPMDSIHSESLILLGVSVNELADIFYKDNLDDRASFVRLCQNSLGCGKNIRFHEGFNSLLVKARDHSGNEGFTMVNFTVDTKPPRINEILPEQDEYVQGRVEFLVDYDEDNVVSIMLHYGTDPNANQVELSNCPSGNDQICTKVLDVSAFNGQLLNYYFTINDVIQSTNSEIVSVFVDAGPPVMTVTSPQNTDYGKKKVLFDISVNEPVRLDYIDLLDKRPKLKKLCADCMAYHKSIAFKDGPHEVIISAKDISGNLVDQTILFTTDSEEPEVDAVFPKTKKYTDGLFIAEYNEVNLQSAKLTIIDQSAGTHEYPMICPPGEDLECIWDVDVSSMHGQMVSYYFTLMDKFLTTNSKEIKKVTIDTQAPQILSFTSPEEGALLSQVELIATFDEDVTVQYILDAAAPKKVCTKCDAVDKRITVSESGAHSVTLIGTDMAGNMVSATRSFTKT